jgi:hypothetical protein
LLLGDAAQQLGRSKRSSRQHDDKWGVSKR